MSKNKNSTISKSESDTNSTNSEKQAFHCIKSKVEILDIAFHPNEKSIIYAGLINGKIKM